MADSPDRIVSDAAEQIDEAPSFSTWVRNSVVGGVFLAIGYGIINIINATADMIMRPLEAAGAGIGRFIEATFGQSVVIIEVGGLRAERSFLDGVAAALGPAAFPAAVLTVILTLWIFAWGWERIGFSPLDWFSRMRRRRM